MHGKCIAVFETFIQDITVSVYCPCSFLYKRVLPKSLVNNVSYLDIWNCITIVCIVCGIMCVHKSM